MRVFNLFGKNGQFETSPLNGEGLRAFGLWSYSAPAKSDLVVFKSIRTGNNVLYQLTEDAVKSFTGSNGDSYWRGKMLDVILSNNLTEKIAQSLQKEGL